LWCHSTLAVRVDEHCSGHNIAHLTAVRAGIHLERTTGRAWDRTRKLESCETSIATEPHGGRKRRATAKHNTLSICMNVDSRQLAVEPNCETVKSIVGNKRV
jgi:hypothetical protein